MDLKIIKKRKIWYIISSTLIAISVLSLLIFGLKPAIDFTGGTLMEIELTDDVNENIDISNGNEFGKYSAQIKNQKQEGFNKSS